MNLILVVFNKIHFSLYDLICLHKTRVEQPQLLCKKGIGMQNERSFISVTKQNGSRLNHEKISSNLNHYKILKTKFNKFKKVTSRLRGKGENI